MYKILIIEDDEIIVQIVKRHLESWGYEVFQIEDFTHVIQEFVQKDPQLVLLDLKLPFFNGFHWCEEIRKISQVPVMFLSSAADNMNMVMAMSRGADAVSYTHLVILFRIRRRSLSSFFSPGPLVPIPPPSLDNDAPSPTSLDAL